MRKIGSLCLGFVAATVCGVPAFAQDTLSPALAAKAKEFKEADSKYEQAACGSASKEQLKGVHDYVLGELRTLITNSVTASPYVQKALDTATAAGEMADKAASMPTASDQEKSLTAARFQQAKAELHAVAAREKAFIEAEVAKTFGFALIEAAPCVAKAAPSEPEHRRAKAKPARRNHEASKNAPAQSSSSFQPSVSVGGSGSSSFSLGGSGGSVSFGR